MLDQTQRDQLGTRYRLHIKTLSPLHVGAGGSDLQRRTPDFLPVSGQLIVIDPNKLADVLGPHQIERLVAGVSLAELLKGLRDDQKAALAAYTLQDSGDDVKTIRPHIKLPGARPYLPGSSLKGALRTALAWAMLSDDVVRVTSRNLGPNRQKADNWLDRALFGEEPNYDLLRALQVGDSEGAAWQGGLHLAQVAVYSLQAQKALAPKGPRYRFHLETIPENVEFIAQARRDNYILEPDQASQLRFDKVEYLLRLPHHVNRLAAKLIEQERDFYRRYGPLPLVDFYDQLEEQLNQLDQDRACLAQVAWGTGWTSKTVGTVLDEALLKEIRTRYRLGRRNTVFPKTRRLVEHRSEPIMPLGWLQVTFEPLGEEIVPPVIVQAKPVKQPRERGRPRERTQKLENIQVGQIVEGTVTRIVHFGAFVNIGLRSDGLIHISELSEGWVDKVEDVVQVGEVVRVKIIEVDVQRSRVGLSIKRV